MGMFDTFIYSCSSCGKETSSQTKLGKCLMDNLIIGCEFPRDGKIMMKDGCEHCGEPSVVVIVDGIIIRFIGEKEATFIEERWGNCERINDANEEKEE